MPYPFTSSAAYSYTQGAKKTLFLGACPETGEEVGIKTERHAITIAGARSGKGAAFIMPNLLRWPHAVLCIDPKGENAAKTWQARQAMGQTVAVLDPFGISTGTDAVRAMFNPLQGIGAYTPRAREKLEALADGMVVVHDPRHQEWVDGARSIIAGVLAFTVATAPPNECNLQTARKLLLSPPEIMEKIARLMLENDACGGLAQDAGATILAALTDGKGMPPAFLEGAKRGTRWIDAPEIANCLKSSSFDLGGLKTDSLSLYLVLQPDEIRAYAAFFRLFVKAALKVMMTDEPEEEHRCLFILDEFYSLGKVGTIAEAAGLMAGYGVTLWPFLQDVGQLKELYGDNGAETFFGNADAEIYFNNKDALTLRRISDQLEKTKPDDVESGPPGQTPFVEEPFPHWRWRFWESEKRALARHELEQRNLREAHRVKHSIGQAGYEHKMRNAGAARMTPSEVAALIGKGNDEDIARSAIIFAKAGDVLNTVLWPFFMEENPAKNISSERKTVRFFAAVDARWKLEKDEDNPNVTLARNLHDTMDIPADPKTIRRSISAIKWALFIIVAANIEGISAGWVLAGAAVYWFATTTLAVAINQKFDEIARNEISKEVWEGKKPRKFFPKDL